MWGRLIFLLQHLFRGRAEGKMKEKRNGNRIFEAQRVTLRTVGRGDVPFRPSSLFRLTGWNLRELTHASQGIEKEESSRKPENKNTEAEQRKHHLDTEERKFQDRGERKDPSVRQEDSLREENSRADA